MEKEDSDTRADIDFKKKSKEKNYLMIKTKLIVILIFAMVLVSCSVNKTAGRSAGIAYSELPESKRRKFDYYFYEGIKLKEERNFDQALEAFRMCLLINPDDAGINAELGMLHGFIGQNAEATNMLEKAVKVSPDNWWYNLRLLNVYRESENFEKATALAESLKKRFPHKEEVYDILISLYRETGQFKKAIAAYDKIEAIAGIDETTSFEKFRLYLELNQLKKGIAEIDKLIRKYPDESRYKVLRGDIYMEQKMPEKALELYNSILASDPDNPHVYVSLSEYYDKLNQSDKATEAILQALKSDRFGAAEKVQILGQYAQSLLKDSTRFGETESLFKLLVDRYPLDEQVHNYYSVFLQFQKRIPEAISEVETMLNINPKNEQTWLQLIQLHYGEKNLEDVVEITKRAAKVMPETGQWYYFRTIAEFQLEKYLEAIEAAREGIKVIEPTELRMRSDLHSLAGDSWFKLNEKDSAYAEYENSVKANPQNISVLNNYAYYLSLEKKDLKKAERMSALTVEKEPDNSTYLDTYAWIFYQQENYVLAKFYIERAIGNLAPEHDPGVIFEHYGDILWMNGDQNKAMEMWQKSLESGNDSEDLKTKIENKGLIK